MALHYLASSLKRTRAARHLFEGQALDGLDLGSAHGSGQDKIPMIIQEVPLAFAEPTYIDDPIGLNAHPVQRRSVGDWRDN
jgi:hypothetical protein